MRAAIDLIAPGIVATVALTAAGAVIAVAAGYRRALLVAVPALLTIAALAGR